MRRQPVRPILAAATPVALLLFWFCTVSESLAGEYLTPDLLAMPRRQIALQGTDLRLFNARGSLTFRERTVTGIAELFIAPRSASRVPVSFNLSFREETLGALIEDNQDEWGEGTLNVWQHWNPANKELGIYKGWGDALILPSQRATWAPDAYTRRGTFHHYLGKDMISFGVISCTVPAADEDGAYEELTITNRTDRPLSLTLLPDQPRGGDKRRSACFSRREGEFTLQALCDIGPSQGDGWRLALPARGQRIVHVALLVADAGAAEPAGHHAADLAARFAASRQATLDLLRRAAAQLPRIETGNPRLDAFYQRSILSLLQCRRDRADSPIRPFYDIGFGDGNSVAWDVSFSAGLLTMFAPDEAKRMLAAFLSAGGVFNSTWLSAKDGRAGSFYMQSPFALLDIAQRYMRQTGNRSLLEEKAGAKTVFEHFRDGAQTLLDSYVKDGLIDAGEGTGKMLEIRTSGYEHIVAAINGMAVDYLQQVADWCRERRDAKADVFQAAARRVHDEIERRLWDESAGWYINLYPDGSRHRVMSYHVFDLLRQPSMPEAHRRRLARHIVPGKFLGPYGMYSIALSDDEHWDMQDCDWGGGGQYVGQPLRIAESLFQMEEPERGWEVLNRCLLWVERFPYFPQTIYTEELAMQEHERGWSLQISAGAGAQAILHGVFGLMPQDDGSLAVRPHYDKSLGTASLKGYHFRDHLYNLRMDAKTFQVFRDGVRLAEERHNNYITITEQGKVRRDLSGLPWASSADSAKPPGEVNAGFRPAIVRLELDREKVCAGKSAHISMDWSANVATRRDYQLSLNLVGIGRPPDFSTNLVLRPPTSRWAAGDFVRQEAFTLTLPANLSPGWRRLLFSLTEPGAPDRPIPLANADRHEHNSQYCFGEIEILPAGSNVPSEPVVRLPTSDPAKPERPNEEWRLRHGERVADVQSHSNALDVLFIGDSITGGWLNIGKAVWEREFVPLRAVNIGIAGSQTSHILWQFENGAIDGMNPRVTVLMIGVNNVIAAPSQSAADIARGISVIVAKLRERLPRTKVLLLGAFPKDRSPTTPDRRKIQEINTLIAKLDDGKGARFLDIGGRLLDKEGNMTADVSPDGVHLTEKGYRIWAEAIGPVVREMAAQQSSRQTDLPASPSPATAGSKAP